MAKQKACKSCKTIYEGVKCPKCESTESVDGFKGKVAILDSENSEIAKALNISEKGVYAVKLR